MVIVRDKVLDTVTMSTKIDEKPLSVTAMRSGCTGGSIVINFNRYKHCSADVMAMLTVAITKGELDAARIIGRDEPLEMTEVERRIIEDFKNDEKTLDKLNKRYSE